MSDNEEDQGNLGRRFFNQVIAGARDLTLEGPSSSGLPISTEASRELVDPTSTHGQYVRAGSGIMSTARSTAEVTRVTSTLSRGAGPSISEAPVVSESGAVSSSPSSGQVNSAPSVSSSNMATAGTGSVLTAGPNLGPVRGQFVPLVGFGPLMNSIECFNGEGGPSTARQFLESIQNVAKLGNWNDEQCLSVGLVKLKGMAFDFITLHPNPAVRASWSEFKEAILARFQVDETQVSIMQKFYSTVQRPAEDVRSYGQRLSTLCQMAYRSEGKDPGGVRLKVYDNMLLARFLHGLKQSLRKAVASTKPADYKEALSTASTLEELDKGDKGSGGMIGVVAQRPYVQYPALPASPVQGGPLRFGQGAGGYGSGQSGQGQVDQRDRRGFDPRAGQARGGPPYRDQQGRNQGPFGNGGRPNQGYEREPRPRQDYMRESGRGGYAPPRPPAGNYQGRQGFPPLPAGRQPPAPSRSYEGRGGPRVRDDRREPRDYERQRGQTAFRDPIGGRENARQDPSCWGCGSYY